MTCSTIPAVPCLVCGRNLEIRNSTGRKSGKPFLMLICPEDGRHFRGFITHQGFVREVMEKLVSESGWGPTA